jgi:hypothetical protein
LDVTEGYIVSPVPSRLPPPPNVNAGRVNRQSSESVAAGKYASVTPRQARECRLGAGQQDRGGGAHDASLQETAETHRDRIDGERSVRPHVWTEM